jgi:hypothetical protein
MPAACPLLTRADMPRPSMSHRQRYSDIPRREDIILDIWPFSGDFFIRNDDADMRHFMRGDMKFNIARALSALALGSVAVSFATAANATTVTFASTVSFTDPVNKVDLSSNGLNATLTAGVPDLISDFITVTVGTGTWSASDEAISANFTFTEPTPTGTTNDSGTITGGQVNGRSADGTLSIVWPNQPVEFDFADGTKLDVILGGLSEACTSGENCIAGTYDMSASFDVLNVGLSTTPLPATLPLFAGGLGFVAFLMKRRKSAKQSLAV